MTPSSNTMSNLIGDQLSKNVKLLGKVPIYIFTILHVRSYDLSGSYDLRDPLRSNPSRKNESSMASPLCKYSTN